MYDWFESFASVLEADNNAGEGGKGGKGKKRKNGGEEQGGGGVLVGGKEEAQARFMRAFHELDFLGLLKGTKRREDCCLKTLFRLPEEEEEEEEGERSASPSRCLPLIQSQIRRRREEYSRVP